MNLDRLFLFRRHEGRDRKLRPNQRFIVNFSYPKTGPPLLLGAGHERSRRCSDKSVAVLVALAVMREQPAPPRPAPPRPGPAPPHRAVSDLPRLEEGLCGGCRSRRRLQTFAI